MKVKAKLSGFDGVKSYQAGTVLEGDSDHIRRLLVSGAAEPLDQQAKDFIAKSAESFATSVPKGGKKGSTEGHPLYSRHISEAAEVAVKSAAKVEKKGKGRKKK